jgi:hypothetical protein
VDPFFLDAQAKVLDMRHKLRSALSQGIVAGADTLDECGLKVAAIIDVDSLDFVELEMALEEAGKKLNTVDDLMRFMDEALAKS